MKQVGHVEVPQEAFLAVLQVVGRADKRTEPEALKAQGRVAPLSLRRVLGGARPWMAPALVIQTAFLGEWSSTVPLLAGRASGAAWAGGCGDDAGGAASLIEGPPGGAAGGAVGQEGERTAWGLGPGEDAQGRGLRARVSPPSVAPLRARRQAHRAPGSGSPTLLPRPPPLHPPPPPHRPARERAAPRPPRRHRRRRGMADGHDHRGRRQGGRLAPSGGSPTGSSPWHPESIWGTEEVALLSRSSR